MLVKTTNVVEADRCIEYLLNRPKLEMVGLGLLYGEPGLGKTTYAQRVAFSRGYVYLRLDSLMSPKSFAQELKRALMKQYGMGDWPVYGSTMGIYQSCIGLLTDHPETVIIIDEVDYAFRHREILGAIRDIVDETLAVVILVGMGNAQARLMQINRYYFDRCGIFYKFEAPTKKDIQTLANTIMSVSVDDGVIGWLQRKCEGTLRDVIKLIYSIESLAAALGKDSLSIHDVDPGELNQTGVSGVQSQNQTGVSGVQR